MGVCAWASACARGGVPCGGGMHVGARLLSVGRVLFAVAARPERRTGQGKGSW